MHLVSFEGWESELASRTLGNGTHARLVVLASWSFNADKSKGDLEAFFEAMQSGRLRVEPNPVIDTSPEADLLKQAVDAGYVPLQYEMRSVPEKTIAWYRGPLLPDVVRAANRAPFESAESGLVFDSTTGMFDTSYAVAWQLGRLLALSDAQFAEDLSRWRQAGHQKLDALLQQEDMARRFNDNLHRSLEELEERMNELVTNLGDSEQDQEAVLDAIRQFLEEYNDEQSTSRGLAHFIKEVLVNQHIAPPDLSATPLIKELVDPRERLAEDVS